MKAIIVHYAPGIGPHAFEAVAFVNDDAPELAPAALGALVADAAVLGWSVRVMRLRVPVVRMGPRPVMLLCRR